jgi:branched-chain amino acid transport system permease protein
MITKRRIRRGGYALGGVVALGAVALPQLTNSDFVIRVALFTTLWTAFAASWNLFSGYSGYYSFGHGIFFGVGAFSSTWLLVTYDVPTWAGMLVGALLAVVIALVIGAVTLHLSGLFFGLAMLSVPMALIPVLIWLGYTEISIPFQPGRLGYMSYRSVINYYYISLAMAAISLGASWWVLRSRMGYYLRAIKGSEKTAESLGVNTFRYKLLGFSLSAFLSALIGTVYIQSTYFFTPESAFGLDVSVEPLVLSIVGGVGTLFGPVVGGLILLPLQEFLRTTFGEALPGIHTLIFGVLLMISIVYLPKGIHPTVRDFLYKRAEDSEETDGQPAPQTELPSESEQ